MPPPPPLPAPAPRFDPGAIAEAPGRYPVVRVFYATNRGATGAALPSAPFDARRGRMSYGSTDVSIPLDHKVGEVERPSFLSLKWLEDAESHVTVRSLRSETPDSFIANIRRRVEKGKDHDAFIFVHGYNVDFLEAVRRTAQMAFDLDFRGVPILFSWPSGGRIEDYLRDETNVEWAQRDLQELLETLRRTSGTQVIDLIAHSMGSRALTRALIAARTGKPGEAVFRNLILAAPDIDADVFRRDILPRLREAGTRVTLYASNQDAALAASKKVHGYRRAGDAEGGPLVEPGMDTIDASGGDASLLGHSYFADVRSVLSDLRALLVANLGPDLRPTLKAAFLRGLKYWRVPL